MLLRGLLRRPSEESALPISSPWDLDVYPAYAKLDISPVEMEVLEHAAKIAATLGDDDDDDDMMAPPPGGTADAP